MTVEKFAKNFEYEILCLPNPNREIGGGYAGDLLSWVMGRLGEDEAWVTIMSNINVVAVASLADVACVIFSEDVDPDDEAVQKAQKEGVNLLKVSCSSYEICAKLAELI